MSRRILAVLLVISVGFNLASLSGYFLYRQVHSKQYGMSDLRKELNLSRADEARVIELRRSMREIMRQASDSQSELQMQLTELMSEKAFDDADLQQTIAQVTNERGRIQREAIRLIIDFRNDLSPAARVQFSTKVRVPGFSSELLGISPLTTRSCIGRSAESDSPE
ncbi:MAG TPA: periplasmic heavy metal sensor [Amphiplicatus sp.]|nr:periplasmic heavy metal sensor [Amphiplicatus sp.]MCB9956137.1 periplasmic heavy metal sensor [Caulobacterales bacterium]HOP18444.1 periplasmic heavy metal sensor [Amphiplicatus sp.]